INYPNDNPVAEYLPYNALIEIELIPVGAGLYRETKSFKVTRQSGLQYSAFSIQNIPVGKYTINAKLSDGRALKMKATGPAANVYEKLGLKPDNATGTSTV